MPPRTPRQPPRLPFPGHVVTAVLVSHDGSRWLPDCLAALNAQVRPPQRVVAVDTGSTDGSARLLAEALGKSAVLDLPRETSFAAAVQAGLDAFAGAPAPPGTSGAGTEWVWILHDDCAPDPAALRELLAEAVDSPSVAAVGPKVTSWDGRRLQQVGLTVDSSGRPQTGLEPRELDQGQHDDIGDVLAVGTAGMLVRRQAWDAVDGLDPTWPLFGEDIDFGWRLNATGERVRVAPRAVVRHAAALGTGRRTPTAIPGRPAAVARRNGLQVVLANTAAALVPLLVLRYVVEAVLRAAGSLVFARRPRAALDELVALGGLLRRPGVVLAARRRRRGRTVGHRALRPMLAPPMLRWRRFGDLVAGTFAGRAAAEERRRRRAPVETGPVSDDAESMDLDDSGVLLRAARRPGVLLALALTAVGLVASRSVLGGVLHGGRLLPAPAGAANLWSLYTASWHPVGLGSTTPTPPSVALLALLSSVLFGKAWLAVDLLLLGAVPLAGMSAYAAAGAVTRSTRLRVWSAVVYAVLPVLTGAVAGGRLDVVVAVILLPLAARAMGSALAVDRQRWYRWVGAGLLLAVTTAFAPVIWILAAAVLLAAVLLGGSGRRVRAVASAAMLAVPLVVLLPWTTTVLTHPRLLVAGSGLAETFSAHRPAGPADLLLLHPGGPSQPPMWVVAPFVLAAVAGLARRRGSRLAWMGFTVFAVGVAGGLVVSRLTGADPADPAVRFWNGAPLAVAAVGMLIAGLVAADDARSALRRHTFGWRQPVAGVVAVAALAGTAVALVADLARGTDRPLTDTNSSLLPVFAAAEVGRPTAPRVVALRADGAVVRYFLVRDPVGPRLGDGDVAPRPETSVAGRRLADAVRAAAAGQAAAVPALAGFGVTLLVVPAGGPPALARLAEVDGLGRVPTAGAVVWHVGIPTGELVVLPPSAAKPVTAGADLPSGTTPRPLPARAGRADAQVPAGPPGRLLVLAEPASSAWHARLDGTPLTATRAYGWAQAWQLPAGGGHLVVSRAGDNRGWELAGELAIVVVLLVLALPARRRHDDEPSGSSDAPVTGHVPLPAREAAPTSTVAS